MKNGVVKFWHEEKGYGFIVDDETKKDFYVYKKSLSGGHTRLFNNNRVSFDLKENCGRDKNQTHAVNVHII